MNMGGPAYQVSLLSGLLDPDRYVTTLVTGRLGLGEAPLDEVASQYGVSPVSLDSLGPELHPWADGRALQALMRIMRQLRPDIVHTHTAKAGVLGRLAALLAAVRPRPVLVHTFHGHVLEGYFSPPVSAVYRRVERLLASRSDCLIGVSQATVDDLVRLRVASRDDFRVVPLGLDLGPLLLLDRSVGAPFRASIGVADDEILLSCVGRLVPIKRIDVMLKALAAVRSRGVRARLVVVGDGVLRPQLERLASDLGIAEAVTFAGYRRDLPQIVAASDIGILTSDNEGTPVSLIEAAAGARVLVATDVGGVADVVTDGTGLLVAPRDHDAVADAVVRLAEDAQLRARMGAAARDHVQFRYARERLVEDVTALYDELLATRRPAPEPTPQLRGA